MIFSKTTGYGIRALAYIARQPGHRLCGLQEIAEREDIPPSYLRKILGELRRHRFLRSVKGIHGGYELGRAPEAITLWEIFSVLEPDPHLDRCILGSKVCSPDCPCAFHDDWQSIRKQIEALLQSRTIAEAASEISRPQRSGNTPQSHDESEENGDLSKDENHGISQPV